MNYLDQINRNIDDGSFNLLDPRLLLASHTSNDNLHYGGAMAADDKNDFIAAMQEEIKALNDDDVWHLELKRNIPTNAKLIILIWSFKRN